MPSRLLYIDELENLIAKVEYVDEGIVIHLPEELEKLNKIKKHIKINDRFLKEYLIEDKYILRNSDEFPEDIKIECVDDTSKIKILIASLNKNTGFITKEKALTNYELSLLAQFNRLPTPISKQDFSEETFHLSRTDLHNHYPALMTAKKLVEIATKVWKRPYYCDNKLSS